MNNNKQGDELVRCPEHHDTNAEFVARSEKVATLRAKGVESWPENISLDSTTAGVKALYQEGSTTEHTIAGRVMTIRKHGKSLFAHIRDRSGALQIYIKADDNQEVFAFFEQDVDLGDIALCKGYLFKTKTQEITLHVTSCTLLSKCLRPMPEKFHGLVDQETKYRQRYLDIMVNDDARNRFVTRSRIVKMVRHYLDSNDFLEVETPMLHPIPGGAAARPFITHHNTLDTDFYLRIAPELYLKRLVVGGFDRVYEVNRNFRNEGVSTRHNPEFTMLEFYMAYQDYHFIMKFVETLLRSIAHEVVGSEQVAFGDHVIDFSKPFARISAKQALITYAKISEGELSGDAIDQTAKKYGIAIEGKTYNEKVFALFEALAEKKLIQPTFLIDYPVEISPLAKRDAHDKTKAARFELFIAGMEISNGFNELNDPFDQADRFKEQVRARAGGDEEAMCYDADYITALEYGLPPTVGVGIGIDRLTMLMTNTTSIKEVILFPALKHKVQE